MKTILIAGFLLLAPMAFGQDHAATPDVCRADAAVWETAVISSLSGEAATKSIPIVELTFRSYEMNQCQITDDGDKKQQTAYQALYDIYLSSIVWRFQKFITRHGMM